MILGFDTATRATAVALWDADGGLAREARDDPPRGARPRHAARLMPLIAELLSEAKADWPDIERIAVGVGPGTFTGLRIGIATARALGQATGIPLVAVSTLQSLAMLRGTPQTEAADVVLAVLDARRGEVFAAAWTSGGAASPAGEPIVAPRAVRPEALAAELAGRDQRTLAVGDGAVEFRLALTRSGARIPEDDSELHKVTALNHCRLAEGRRPRPPEAIRPEYLRLPDAEISRRAARKR